MDENVSKIKAQNGLALFLQKPSVRKVYYVVHSITTRMPGVIQHPRTHNRDLKYPDCWDANAG